MAKSKAWQYVSDQFKQARERFAQPEFGPPLAPEYLFRRILRDYVKARVRYWRKRGFPDYVLNYPQKAKKLRSLMKYDHSRLIVNGVVKQKGMHALDVAWSHFPHQWSVRCGNRHTPLEVFDDDKLLEKAIYKRLTFGGFSITGKSKFRLTAAELRKGLRTYSGTQGVSNFRPTAAAAIYHRYMPDNGGVTWDMSCGWGGRLLGAMACHKVHKYIGCDPSTETWKGLVRMKLDLLPSAMLMGRELDVEIYKLGSETKEMRDKLPEGGVDLCFTSPPYFSRERYSDEETQSWVKYKTPDAWLTGFLGQTLDNCAFCLKPDGCVAINIADVAEYPDLSERLVEYAERKRWKLVETLRYSLSSMMGTKHKHNGKPKDEPIYVFNRATHSPFRSFSEQSRTMKQKKRKGKG
ncbi:MAG TPA: DNA methyltransferase [Terriglobales bacterium]|nr:DNA methyltransferase [Terriglobales bacterium]